MEMGRLCPFGAQLTQWPTTERVAVERSLKALRAVGLSDGRPAWEVTDLIKGITHATGGLERWLVHLCALRGPGSGAGGMKDNNKAPGDTWGFAKERMTGIEPAL
jgi:hypothetical protein